MPLPCPRCPAGSPLTEHVVRRTGGGADAAIHLCGVCKGVWLDRDVLPTVCPTLSHLPERSDEAVLAGRPGAGIASCPRCLAEPVEVDVIEVPIDFCARCGGVWLDGDEYDESAFEGAERRDADRGGPYRGVFREVRSAEIRCAQCARRAAVAETFAWEIGLVCAACHLEAFERRAHERAEE